MRLHCWLAMAAVACLPCAAGPAAAQGSARAPSERFRPLDVRINQAPAGTWTLLERNGRLYAPEEAFADWRLNRPPASASIPVRGDTWYALDAVAGYEAIVNEAEQRIDLVFSSSAFSTTRLTRVGPERVQVAPVEPALFLNYDLSADHTAPRGAASRRTLGALTELGLGTSWGLLASSYSGQNLVTGGPDPGTRAWRRLETSFTRDFVEGGTTLRLGDLSTRGGVVGRSVYFGGVQWSRNFSLQPGFASVPLGQMSQPNPTPRRPHHDHDPD